MVKLSRFIYRLFRRTTEEYMDDNCPSMAAAMSFYILLTLFPMTLAFISALGFILRTHGMEARVIEALGDAFPVSRDFIKESIRGVVNARGLAGAMATLGLAWAGLALFGVVRKGLNAAFGITMPKPYWHERFREFLMMLAAGALLLISMASTTFLGVLRRWSLHAGWPSPLDSDLLWQGGGTFLAFALTLCTFLMLYKFVPYARLRWRDIWLGALLGTLGFEIVKVGFAWYVQSYVNYSVLYGSVGAVVVFLVWAYASATVLLYGAEFASVFPRVMAATREAAPPQAPARPPRHTLPALAALGCGLIKRLLSRKR